MGRTLGTLAPFITRRVDSRTLKTEVKYRDPHYVSAEHLEWREAVLARAGRRCQAIENGLRCGKAEPAHRMYADHIIEKADGGAPLDPGNGQCLCGRHHTLKTARARQARASRG